MSPAPPQQCDLAVVGGGILGLAVARELTRRRPGASATVLEAAPEVASGQTGTNSGVIHAGIYYAPGSLKAQLCVAGAREMYAYCEANSIAHERCGKLIVARQDGEVAALDELERRGRANEVPGLRRLGADELRRGGAALRGHGGAAVTGHGHRGLRTGGALAGGGAGGRGRAGGHELRGHLDDGAPGPRGARTRARAHRGALRRGLRRSGRQPPGAGRRRSRRPAHRALPRRLPLPAARAPLARARPDLSGARPVAALPRRAPQPPHRRPGVARSHRAARPARRRATSPGRAPAG